MLENWASWLSAAGNKLLLYNNAHSYTLIPDT